MNDITDVLIDILTDLIKRDFHLPIHIFGVSGGGCVVAARYEWDVKNEGKIRVFADHKEGNGWSAPIHFYFLDDRGEAATARIDSESPTDTSEPTH